MDDLQIFICYSHKDARWFDEKNEHCLIPWLEDILRARGIRLWYDRGGLKAGDQYRKELRAGIDHSQIALLLISWSFLSSEFILKNELPRIQAREDQHQMTVIPVLVSPCDYKENPQIEKYQILPGQPTPLVKYTEKDADWEDAKHQILTAILERAAKIRAAAQTPTEPSPWALSPTTPPMKANVEAPGDPLSDPKVHEEVQPSPTPPVLPPAPAAGPGRQRWGRYAAVALVAFGIVAGAWWVLGRSRGTTALGPSAPASPPPSVQVAVVPKASPTFPTKATREPSPAPVMSAQPSIEQSATAVNALGIPKDAVPLSLALDPQNPSVFYIGTLDHGVFRSGDGAMTWESLSDQLKAVLGIAVDPDDSQTLYAVANGTMMKSTDGGSTWGIRSTGTSLLGNGGGFPLNISTSRGITDTVIYTGEYSSVDGGNSWQRFGDFDTIAIDPRDPMLIYAANGSGGVGSMQKSTDGGKTWIDFMNGLPKARFTAIALDPQTSSTLYVGTSAPLHLFKSDDSGANWLPIENGLGWGGISSIVIDPKMPNRVFIAIHGVEYAGFGVGVSEPGGLFVSVDSGKHWSRQWP